MQIYQQYMMSLEDFLQNPQSLSVTQHGSIAILNNHQLLFYIVSPAQFGNMPTDSNSLKNNVVTPDNHLPFESFNDLSFKIFVDAYLQQTLFRVERGELTEKSYKIICYRLKKHILPFLGDIPVNEIRYPHLEGFVDYLSKQKIGGVAIAQYLAIVRKILKDCLIRQLIHELPQFPVVIGKRKSRGGFNLKEYRTLLRVSWQMRGSHFEYQHLVHLNAMGLDQRLLVMREELHHLIGFMANSFVRPSDIKVMQHKHVEIIDNQFRYLRLTLPETKKHGKPIVTLRRAVSIYEKMVTHASVNGYGKPDDYVFLPDIANRNYAMRILGFLFNWLLHETNLKTGPHATPRTLYSLRHTSITFRLLYGQGIDMLTLARNARTSVNMIEKHYASTLSGEMNIDLLQSKRSVKKN